MASHKSHNKDTKYKQSHRKKLPGNPRTYFRENPRAPVRVLVSTATHLVPGDGYSERSTFIANAVCQHLWGDNFNYNCDRIETCHADFAFDNRTCYFLVDRGKCPAGEEKKVPILWYRWTGKTLGLVHQRLFSLARKKIRRVRFNRSPFAFRPRFTALEKRKHILKCLNRDMGISRPYFKFLSENPEHVGWLQRKLHPKLWAKLKSLQAEWASGIMLPIDTDGPKDPTPFCYQTNVQG